MSTTTTTIRTPRPLRFGDRGYREFIAAIYDGQEDYSWSSEILKKLFINDERQQQEQCQYDDSKKCNCHANGPSLSYHPKVVLGQCCPSAWPSQNKYSDRYGCHHRMLPEIHHRPTSAGPAVNQCSGLTGVSGFQQQIENVKQPDEGFQECQADSKQFDEQLNNHPVRRRIRPRSIVLHLAKGNLAKSRASNNKQDRTYECDYPRCEKKFSRKEELTRHKRTHSKERSYQCEICSRKFGRKDHRKKHMSTHDDIADRRRYVCSERDCGKRYTRSDALSRHRNKAHSAVYNDDDAAAILVEYQEKFYSHTSDGLM